MKEQGIMFNKYLKGLCIAKYIVGIIIFLFWLSYFLTCEKRLPQINFEGENRTISFLRILLNESKGYLANHIDFFGDDYFLLEFPSTILVYEIIFITILIFNSVANNLIRKQLLILTLVSLFIFYCLYVFLDETLILFVPG